MNPRSSSAFVVSRPISSTLAARPVATRMQLGARSRSAPCPRGRPSSVTPSLPALTDVASKRAFVMTVMPRRVKLRSSSWLTSRSSSGTIGREVLEERHLDAEVVVHRGELDADRAGADDDDVLRQRVGGEDVVRGDDPLRRPARGRAATSPASPVARMTSVASRTRSPPAPGVPSSPCMLDADRRRARRGGRGRRSRSTLFLSMSVLRPVHIRFTTWSRRAAIRGVVDDGLAGDVDAEVLGVADALGEGGRLEERLGRDAAAVEARAADLVLVDEGDLEAELGGPEGGRVAAGAGAEDDEVEVVGRADGHGQAISGRRRDVARAGDVGRDGKPGGRVASGRW